MTSAQNWQPIATVKRRHLPEGSKPEAKVWKMAPTKNPEDRKAARAESFPEIAEAMARAWA